jgi:hypothetical protein
MMDPLGTNASGHRSNLQNPVIEDKDVAILFEKICREAGECQELILSGPGKAT